MTTLTDNVNEAAPRVRRANTVSGTTVASATSPPSRAISTTGRGSVAFAAIGLAQHNSGAPQCGPGGRQGVWWFRLATVC